MARRFCRKHWPWMVLAFAITIVLSPLLAGAYVADVVAEGRAGWDPGW